MKVRPEEIGISPCKRREGESVRSLGMQGQEEAAVAFVFQELESEGRSCVPLGEDKDIKCGQAT